MNNNNNNNNNMNKYIEMCFRNRKYCSLSYLFMLMQLDNKCILNYNHIHININKDNDNNNNHNDNNIDNLEDNLGRK